MQEDDDQLPEDLERNIEPSPWLGRKSPRPLQTVPVGDFTESPLAVAFFS